MTGHFRYTTYTFDPATGEASFHYELTRPTGDVLPFTEKLLLPAIAHKLDMEHQQMVASVLEMLHLAIGTSYWKIDCSIAITYPYVLSQTESDFWNLIYTQGLGEFYYTNKLDPSRYVLFTAGSTEETKQPVRRINGVQRALTGIGGGKDSLVAVDILDQAAYPFDLYYMENTNQAASLDQVIDTTKHKGFRIERTIDAQLRTLKNGYKGHVPISLLYALVGVLIAVVHNYSSVIVSNEESSNYGNVEYKGYTINHQWSKSAQFEKVFQHLIHSVVSPDITYFSLMRPFTELRIAQQFAHLTKYHSVFSSCNRNFRINPEQKSSGLTWCGRCSKCAFTFAMLSGYIAKHTLVSLFGKNMYADESLLKEYRMLLGTESIKPFDCVGTPDEVAAAFFLAHKTGQYETDAAMQYFVTEVLPPYSANDQMVQSLLEYKNDELIPQPFTDFLHTYDASRS